MRVLRMAKKEREGGCAESKLSEENAKRGTHYSEIDTTLSSTRSALRIESSQLGIHWVDVLARFASFLLIVQIFKNAKQLQCLSRISFPTQEGR